MADWSTMTTGNLSAGTQAATSGFAAALGARRRRELAQESGQTVAQGRYNSDMIAAGKQELKKAKKQAVIGDIATLAGVALMAVPGAAGVIGGALGTSPAMTGALMAKFPALLGGVAGTPSPEVSSVARFAGDVGEAKAFGKGVAAAAPVPAPAAGVSPADFTEKAAWDKWLEQYGFQPPAGGGGR